MDPSNPFYWLILVFGGFVCGLLNTLASSGTAVSLPLLILFLGMNEGVANATNRLPVLVGAVMAAFAFARRGQMDWSAALRLVPPAAVGSIFGVYAAEALTNRQLEHFVNAAVLVALLLLFTKLRKILSQSDGRLPRLHWRGMVLVFFVGFWLGFIVLDGATYLLLILMLVFYYDLPRANALKNLLIAVTSLLPVLIFARNGQILWVEGGVLAAGSIVGGYLGAYLSNVAGARQLAFRALAFVITIELVQLVWRATAPLRA
ncbi:sulfite exporter TauE/SafE family protein [Azorhizobium doebereinerae]|uniref:sulfite exporter TauE/SafE family protein n=1 Tax=Azorhizobium doebereinerae TaxID=281091 RepID=UPI0018DBBBAC|nr:sulfite exporter TauE/SafE family protein [Azorhizobium doebereinerae]